MKTEWKIYLGKKCKRTRFGHINIVRGMYCGGIENYYYGIKGIFGVQIVRTWGKYKMDNFFDK